MLKFIDVPSSVQQENRAAVAQLEAMLADMPPPETIPVAITRDAMASGQGLFGPPVQDPSAAMRSVPTRDGAIGLRIFRPAGATEGLLIHVHGGGWAFGSAAGQDAVHRATADRTGLVVASVDYRLTPEHPLPLPINDVEDALAWIINSDLADGPVLLGGESAGAHLALSALLRLRARGEATRIAALDLNYGVYDLSLTPSCRAWGSRNLILSGTQMAWFVDMATPGLSPEQRRDPALSPLFADLADLPPMRLAVGTLDPLLDDSLFLAAGSQASGNRCQLELYPDAVHGFNFMPGSLASIFDTHRVAWLRGGWSGGQ
jgi:acetyl esterase/lipase